MEESDNLNMGFPKRLYSAGKEPIPRKIINYLSKMEMFPYLKTFLGEELWTTVKESPLGVILKFYELDFKWCSRIVNKSPYGDCGVYALKYIEYHALGVKVPNSLFDWNIENIRLQMALEMFEKTFKHGTSTSALVRHYSVSDYCNFVEFIGQL